MVGFQPYSYASSVIMPTSAQNGKVLHSKRGRGFLNAPFIISTRKYRPLPRRVKTAESYI
jgi:hypothetical protein